MLAASAATTFAFVCLAEAASIASLTFLPTLSLGALAFTVAALVVAGFAPGLSGGAARPASTRFAPRAGAALVTLGVLGLAPPTRVHIAALPFALVAAAIGRGVRTFHDRCTGRITPWWDPAIEVAATYLGCWAFTANFVFLLPVGVAIHRRATLRTLRGAVSPRWGPPAVLAGGTALLLALPRLAEPDPNQCFDAARTRAPAIEAEAGTVTVALLGDSSTEGIFLPGALTYGAILERELNDRADGRRYRVVNCGLRGASSSDLEGQLALALMYRPALVTAYIGYNDQTRSSERDLDQRRSRYRANLEGFVEEARARGSRPILITPPTGRSGNEWLERVRSIDVQIAEARGAGLMDARAAIAARALPARFFVADFVHPNELGHAWLGRALAEQVSAELARAP